MGRPILLIASRRVTISSALCRYVDLLLSQRNNIHDVRHCTFSCLEHLFEELDKLEPAQLRDTMVLLDTQAEYSAWRVKDMRGDSGLAAQLVLAFPEVYFVFLGSCDALRAELASVLCRSAGAPRATRSARTAGDAHLPETIEEHHFVSPTRLPRLIGLIARHAQGFRTIFDATALRSYLKQRLFELAKNEEREIYRPLVQSRCNHVAAAADEESSFVYLNGYVAYRAGFRTWLLTTKNEFSLILPENINERPSGLEQFDLVLSDWDLAFSELGDTEPSELLLTVALAAQEPLIIVSSFITQGQDELLFKDKARADKHDHRLRVLKPYGGIFGLICAQVEPNALGKWNSGKSRAEKLCRNALFHCYREAWSGVVNHSAPPGRSHSTRSLPHSARYCRRVIADRLLSRARSLGAGDFADVTSSVHGALLAGEAKEVLGGRSRTTGCLALALQNEAEVLAEVSFFGAATRIDVDQRLWLLAQEASRLHDDFETNDRKVSREREFARASFLQKITNRLRLRFAEHEQMEAAEACLRQLARYHRFLSRLSVPAEPHWEEQDFREAEGLAARAWAVPGGWYVDAATDAGTSIFRLAWVSGGLVIFFSVFYFLLFLNHPERKPDRGQCAQLAVCHSAMTFLQLQPGLAAVETFTESAAFGKVHGFGEPRWLWYYRLTLGAELLFAYVHLGLLISMLYRYITRRAP